MNLFDYTKKTTDEYSDWLWEHIPQKCLKNILDIGAGDGRLWEEHFSSIPHNASILLMDEDQISLEEAQESFDDQRFKIKVANVETEEFGKNKYDLIYAGSLLPYIIKRQPLYLKIFNSLKKGGCFVCDLNGKKNLIELRNKNIKSILSPLVPQNPIWKLATGVTREKVYKELQSVFTNCQMIKFENEVLVPNAKMLINYHLKFETQMTSQQKKELLSYYQSLSSNSKDTISIQLDWGVIISQK